MKSEVFIKVAKKVANTKQEVGSCFFLKKEIKSTSYESNYHKLIYDYFLPYSYRIHFWNFDQDGKLQRSLAMLFLAEILKDEKKS